MDWKTRIYGDLRWILVDFIRRLNSNDESSASYIGYILFLPVLVGTILDWIVERQIYDGKNFKNRKELYAQLKIDLSNEQLFNKINELILIRDIIIHNHIYGFSILGSERIYTEKIHWNDTLIKNHARNWQTTDIINLNIIPDKLDKKDAFLIIKTFREIIIWFDNAFSSKFGFLFSNYLNNSVILSEKEHTNLNKEIDILLNKRFNINIPIAK